MREYTIVHRLTRNWSSITLDPDDTHALIVRDDEITTVSFDTADCILQYVTQDADYIVERVY